MYNTDSTIGKNLRYFIYKYDLLYDDWFRDLNKKNNNKNKFISERKNEI